jgi:transposase-like protein
MRRHLAEQDAVQHKTHRFWRAVDRHAMALDILLQSRRDTVDAKRPMRKLPKQQVRVPRVPVLDKLPRYAGAKREVMPLGRTPTAQGTEQSRGEFTPARPPAGAAEEALQIARRRAAVSFRPRSGR